MTSTTIESQKAQLLGLADTLPALLSEDVLSKISGEHLDTYLTGIEHLADVVDNYLAAVKKSVDQVGAEPQERRAWVIELPYALQASDPADWTEEQVIEAAVEQFDDFGHYRGLDLEDGVEVIARPDE